MQRDTLKYSSATSSPADSATFGKPPWHLPQCHFLFFSCLPRSARFMNPEACLGEAWPSPSSKSTLALAQPTTRCCAQLVDPALCGLEYPAQPGGCPALLFDLVLTCLTIYLVPCRRSMHEWPMNVSCPTVSATSFPCQSLCFCIGVFCSSFGMLHGGKGK